MHYIKKIKEMFLGKEDYTLKTYDDTDDGIQKNVKRKVAKGLVAAVIIIPIVLILVKTSVQYVNLNYLAKPQIEEAKVDKVKNTELKISNDQIWKTKAETEQKMLKQDMNNVKKTLSDLNLTVSDSTKEIQEQIQVRLDEAEKHSKELKNLITKKAIESEIRMKNLQSDYKKDLKKVKKEIELERKIEIEEKTKIDPSKLIPIGTPVKVDSKGKPILAENGLPIIVADVKGSERIGYEDYKEVEQVEYIDLDEQFTEFQVSTLNNIDEEEIKVKPKSFMLDAGFGKATILAAGEFNTISQGNDERVPIFMSIDSKIITANEGEVDLTGCILRGTGKGDFTTSKVPVTVTHIDCTLRDENGDNYRISEKIHGVVYDESGGYALKGRLITKEGEVFAKALPIALLEAGISILNAKVENQDNEDGDIISFNQSATEGVSKTGETIVGKMGEYWLKYLDALNPKVDVRPGRQIVVAFFGGELLNIKKYIPASLENFENGLLDNVNVEDETSITQAQLDEKNKKKGK